MIKKLRIKFIATSMLSLFLVLGVIMSAVNILNYRGVLTQADSTLAILEENGGAFPQREEPREPGEPGKPGRRSSPELPYESRYFSVRLTQSGSVISVDTGKIAAIGTDDAAEFARQVFESGKSRGRIGDYRYTRQVNDGEIQIIFLDCGRDLSTFRTFLAASCGISLLGLLAVFVLILLLSKRIIRPVLESDRKQKQFITDAGHEIKTPITIIDADAEVLEMEIGENEWIRDIQTQTRRLTALTNDLIFLSRMEEDQARLTESVIPLSDLVQETAQSFQAPALAGEKTLTVTVRPGLSLRGNEKALTQLITILLDNALKYSTPKGDILLTLEEQKKGVCLRVENTCAPIPPEQLEHFFDRFYRADPSRNSQAGGHGLGLSIAKAITQAHGGKIQALIPAPGRLQIRVLFPSGRTA